MKKGVSHSAKVTLNRIMCIPIIERKYETFSDLYDTNWDVVRKFFLYNTNQPDGDAEEYAKDLTQEVFTLMWEDRKMFNCNPMVSDLPEAVRNALTLKVKLKIWSFRGNNYTNQQRKFVAEVDNYEDTGDPNDSLLGRALNKLPRFSDGFDNLRIERFIKDIYDNLPDKKTGDMFLHLFFGYSHDEIQDMVGITHGTFYRRYKDNRELYEKIISKHFDKGEVSGAN